MSSLELASLLHSEEINKALSAALKKNQRDVHAEGDSTKLGEQPVPHPDVPPEPKDPSEACGDGQRVKSLEQLLQDLYVEEEEDAAAAAAAAKTKSSKSKTKDDEPSISIIMKPEGDEASDISVGVESCSAVKPLDQLLKDICESDLAEAENRHRTFKNYSCNVRDAPRRDRDKELTNKEKEQLRDILMQMDFTLKEDPDSDEDDRKRQADPKRLLDPNVTSDLWKQILGKKAFRAGMKEVYKESEEALWPWMSQAERARVKEIDHELERLKETHLAQLNESDLSRMLLECQESLEQASSSP